ncbi:MAG TPA: hypothetical protein P5316_13035 [Phycisphaerae bacterium]|nr:hypothetical protein [Phycisphaerae bacterium]
MSFIHLCRLNDFDPFDFLTELQRHAATPAARPENWMPWNRREGLGATSPA